MSQQLTDKWRALRPLRPLLVGIERLAVRRATVVLPVCEDLAQVVRGWVDPQRVVLLPDVPMGDAEPGGVQESLRAIAGPEALIALYVGNLERYQGIDLMLDGLAQLPRDTPLQTIVIGGSAADIETYRARAAQLGLGDRVHFLGPRPVAHLERVSGAGRLVALAAHARAEHAHEGVLVHAVRQGHAGDRDPFAHPGAGRRVCRTGGCGAGGVGRWPGSAGGGCASTVADWGRRRGPRRKASTRCPAFRARLQQAYVKVAAD